MTNSQAAIHESCLVKCSTRALRFSRSNIHDTNHVRKLIEPLSVHPDHQGPALASHILNSALLVNPSPTDFHAGTTKNCYRATTVHQHVLAPPFLYFHLVASTRQTSTFFFTLRISPPHVVLGIHQNNR